MKATIPGTLCTTFRLTQVLVTQKYDSATVFLELYKVLIIESVLMLRLNDLCELKCIS